MIPAGAHWSRGCSQRYRRALLSAFVELLRRERLGELLDALLELTAEPDQVALRFALDDAEHETRRQVADELEALLAGRRGGRR
jgi:hypothetical protein